MAKMGTAVTAHDFNPNHAMADVAIFNNILITDWLVETGPATAGVVFGTGIEQGLAATATMIGSGDLAVVVLAGKSGLRALLSTYPELVRGKLLAPLFISFIHLLAPYSDVINSVFGVFFLN
jgi:hypothetical protein